MDPKSFETLPLPPTMTFLTAYAAVKMSALANRGLMASGDLRVPSVSQNTWRLEITQSDEIAEGQPVIIRGRGRGGDGRNHFIYRDSEGLTYDPLNPTVPYTVGAFVQGGTPDGQGVNNSLYRVAVVTLQTASVGSPLSTAGFTGKPSPRLSEEDRVALTGQPHRYRGTNTNSSLIHQDLRAI
jgi:hypothetical protein